MKTNQQEEMERHLEEVCRDFFVLREGETLNDHYESSVITDTEIEGIFRRAYTLQQEKIEKLEKVIQDQEKERQGAEAFWKRRLEIHQREIDSLKSDLDKVTMAGIVENWTIGMSNCEQDLREIRLRHNLDKSEEV